MVKTLILLRHAHRDTSNREMDNGLTDKGREQAKFIKKFFFARFTEQDFQSGLWLVSSPKVRCVETLLPLAKELNRSVDRHPQLDEGGLSDSAGGLESRVKSFLQEWRVSKASLTVACSHGDWLPIAFEQLMGLRMQPKKGSWTELEWSYEEALLKWYIPTFKPFSL